MSKLTNKNLKVHLNEDKLSAISSCSDEDESTFFDPNNKNVDHVTIEFLYRPHTLTIMLILLIWLLYKAFYRDNAISSHENYWTATIAMSVVLLVVSMIVMPNGPFTRPHPIIWRIVLGTSLLYMLLLVFWLFQSYEDINSMLVYIDPELQYIKADNKSYAVDCTFSMHQIWINMDHFALAHFIGWFIKAMLIRHTGLLWLISITWEITEVAFKHLLPNFAECWWDAIILDILICNGLGIHLGLAICKHLEMNKYRWESFKTIKGASHKMKRVALQFTPVSWTRVRWIDPSCPYSRYVSICLLCIMWQVNELNCFFIKHIFLIPTKHYLNLFRLILIVFLSAPGLRQYYLYVSDYRCKRLGTHIWMFIFITLIETLVCIRHSKQLFGSIKWLSVLIWILVQIVSCFFLVYFLIKSQISYEKKDHSLDRSQSKKISIAYEHKDFPYKDISECKKQL